MAKKKNEAVENALDEIREQLESAHAAPKGAQAGQGKFSLDKALARIRVIVEAFEPFAPEKVKPILVAIDGELGDFGVGTGGATASADSSEGFEDQE